MPICLTQIIKRRRAEVNETTIREYFDALKNSLIHVESENIVDYDETNFSNNPGKPKVICKHGAKPSDRIINSYRRNISADAGELLPSIVEYKAKHRYENGKKMDFTVAVTAQVKVVGSNQPPF